jgi:hypothetical protein
MRAMQGKNNAAGEELFAPQTQRCRKAASMHGLSAFAAGGFVRIAVNQDCGE